MIDQGPGSIGPGPAQSGQMASTAAQLQKQNNECKDCRACWDRSTANVSYGKH